MQQKREESLCCGEIFMAWKPLFCASDMLQVHIIKKFACLHSFVHRRCRHLLLEATSSCLAFYSEQFSSFEFSLQLARPSDVRQNCCFKPKI